MLARLKSALQPPVFAGDTDNNRVAALLHSILLATLPMSFLLLVLIVLFSPGDPFSLVIIASVVLGQLGLFGLNRGGYTRTAAALLSGLIWLASTVTMYFFGGLENAGMLGYLFVMMVAGILLDRRWIVGFVVLSIASSFVIMLLQEYEALPPPLTISAFFYWSSAASLMLVSGMLILAAYRMIERGFQQAEQNAAALAQANTELRAEIAQRQQAETELAQARDQYQQILERVPVSIVLHDADGKVLYINPAGALLMGGRREELVGRTLWEFTSQSGRRRLALQLEELKTSRATDPLEFQFQTLTGRTVDVQAQSILVRYQGELVIMEIMVDLTALKQVQRELLQAEVMQTELRKEREVIEMKERFVGLISHEFRTPLTIIMLSKENLERYYDRLNEDQRFSHLRKIGSQVRDMVGMLDNVLTMSQIQADGIQFRPTWFDLPGFMQHLVRDLGLNEDSRYTLLLDLDPALGTLFLDERLLRYILSNLITNATKYSPGGELGLSARIDHEWLVLMVSDQGIGIPLEDQPQIFQPFHRGRNTMGIRGTGLGLAIVRESVQAHDGQVSFTSRPGEGTTFTVRLPLRKENPPA